MKCCICGGKIFVDQQSNNPYPLCHRDDEQSRCCSTCNEYVLIARLATIHAESSDEKDLKPWISDVAILWSQNSEKPVEFIAQHRQVMAGTVHDIDRVNGLMTGSWGNFSVDIDEDNWFIIKS